MKNSWLFLRLVILVSVFFGFACSSKAQGFLKTSGTRILDDRGENVLLRGIGLGGWMLQEGYMLRINEKGQQHKIRERIQKLVGEEKTNAFYEAWLSNHTTREDIEAMKAWGFNSVRLPMHYDLYTLPVEKEPVAGKNTWLTKGFAMTDSLLQWCKDNQLWLILDLHAAPGGQGNDLNISDRDDTKPSLWDLKANRDKTIALWKELAMRYVNEPMIAAYDVINEPNWGFEDPNDKNGLQENGNGPLKELLVDITKAIREVDTNHIIIIEGNGWGNNYNGMLPPWDKNMVLSFHKYWNYNNDEAIKHILQTRDQYQVPVWLGETGENSNVWFTEAIRLLEQHNIGWAWWPLKKIGINNPLEIPSSAEYEQLLNYWNGKTKQQPNAATAWKALQQLATAARFNNNIIHRDVVDAMIRQPHSNATIPFAANIINGHAEILAADYDIGSNGHAYFDMDTANYRVSTGKNSVGNRGYTYRNDGVDIEKGKNNVFVSNTEKGEWLQYTLQVEKAGNYTIRLLAGSEKKGAKASLLLNGNTVAKSFPVSMAGKAGEWVEVHAGNIYLSEGKQQLRLYVEEGGFRLSSINFSRN
ncbi:cellulase family glycosylhydrolase [Pseudobacter ginsenosidimutans]|uniref:Cellulase (Glycosyl hydrolase family 5) n=1 Tax=Pseudobacter ginsenosidimutans TaxID=661488 RepID=A0A4Q7MNP3_9BACT|nr:cellulase family glycosylhydrolase [Pseudobacter ginsenosidimutans]QEC45743.1 cellulase family glycosylhydrolase [Pseudobacter ginsenosidimutans]RZS69313.1 cellulase (glycosyl hydrolase family 5) [Pseudobacter ginsenosidimutans]